MAAFVEDVVIVGCTPHGDFSGVASSFCTCSWCCSSRCSCRHRLRFRFCCSLFSLFSLSSRRRRSLDSRRSMMLTTTWSWRSSNHRNYSSWWRRHAAKSTCLSSLQPTSAKPNRPLGRKLFFRNPRASSSKIRQSHGRNFFSTVEVRCSVERTWFCYLHLRNCLLAVRPSGLVIHHRDFFYFILK